MKKYSFLVYHREYIDFLKGIQKLGVLHVIEKESGELTDENLRLKYQQVNELGNAIKFLSKLEVEPSANADQNDGLTIVAELKKIQSDNENYHLRLSHLQKEKSILEPWGDFSWNVIHKLKDAGYLIDFFICPLRAFDESWREKYDLHVIGENGGFRYFVVVRKEGETIAINAEQVNLPELSLSKINNAIAEINDILDKVDELYTGFAAKYLPVLVKTRDNILADLNFGKVLLNTKSEAENKVSILEGWVPKDREADVRDYLESTGIYYESGDPVPADGPPIKLKNNKFARLFESIGELYTFPNYKEIDLTPFFAPFYMLFFGFCLGDLGYGLLIVVATVIGIYKVRPALKPLMKLGMYLGIATILMGMVGGTLFGINLIDSGYTLTSNSFETLRHEVPVDITDKIASLEGIHFKKKDDFLRGISESAGVLAVNEHQTVFLKAAESDYPVLSSFRYMLLDSNKLMILALVLGYIQVLFGMFLKAANRIRMFGVKYAISQFGWITIVAISVPAYGLGYLDMIPAGPANQVALISFIAGMIPALFYNSPGKNPFLNFGVGLWNTYQTASGLLGDVLSYIRLFALGISSAILGNVFNTLAFELSPDPKYIILRQLVIVLILLFGHSLNFFMAALGSFVHPLRLTFVEFYKNADFAGGGNKYEPFRT